MSKTMKIGAAVVGGAVALVALAWGVGAMLPVEHTASASRVVPADPAAVWALASDPTGFPGWRQNVEGVEVLPDVNGLPSWRETAATGSMTLVVTEWEPDRRMVARIADEGLPFGGTWTWELEPVADGTRVTLREDGEIYSPFFRFVSRFVMGYEATMEAWLDALEARVGEGDA